MVTSIIKRNGYFYCGNCRMREEVKENEREGN